MTSEEKVKKVYPEAFALRGHIYDGNGNRLASCSTPRGNLSANERAWDRALRRIEQKRD